MKLSCIITTRNRRATILRTLAQLEKGAGLSEQDWEILVVDNGSSDGTAEAISRNRRVKVISLAENEGVPARNLALVHARGKYIAFLGDDVRPIGRAIPQAVAYLARHHKTAAISGRVILPDGSADAPALPAVLMGGATVVRKSVLDAVGGFASEFFHQAADYELSFRIWRAGHRIERFEDLQFARESLLDHRPSELACRMNLRNNLILCERYLPHPIRQAYRGDWIRRYGLLALREKDGTTARSALKEARVWARREAAVGRKPLDANAIESIFQIEAQRVAVTHWAQSNRVRRVCVADWGKNLFATWLACKAANVSIEAILENGPEFEQASYRRVPVIPDKAADGRSFDGVLISTINPARVDERAAELEMRFGRPVLRLWSPRSLIVPPPNNVPNPSGNLTRKIDRAA